MSSPLLPHSFMTWPNCMRREQECNTTNHTEPPPQAVHFYWSAHMNSCIWQFWNRLFSVWWPTSSSCDSPLLIVQHVRILVFSHIRCSPHLPCLSSVQSGPCDTLWGETQSFDGDDKPECSLLLKLLEDQWHKVWVLHGWKTQRAAANCSWPCCVKWTNTLQSLMRHSVAFWHSHS